jgi:hypothetical protein
MNLANIEEYDFTQWQNAAAKAKAKIETRLFIDGDYVDAIEGGRFTTIDP